MPMLVALAMILVTTAAFALEPRPGWFVANSPKSYSVLLADLKAAVAAEKMGVVT